MDVEMDNIEDPSDFTLFSSEIVDPQKKEVNEPPTKKDDHTQNVSKQDTSQSQKPEHRQQQYHGKSSKLRGINRYFQNSNHVPVGGNYAMSNAMIHQQLQQQFQQSSAHLGHPQIWNEMLEMNQLMGMSNPLLNPALLQMNNFMLPSPHLMHQDLLFPEQLLIPPEIQNPISSSPIVEVPNPAMAIPNTVAVTDIPLPVVPTADMRGQTPTPTRWKNTSEVIHFNSCTLYPPRNASSIPLLSKKPMFCKTVWVGGLPKNTTETIICEIFGRFGEIVDIRKKNLNFCHIRFKKEESVDQAHSFSGYRLVIGNSNSPDDTGLIFVDYSKSREDALEWEAHKKGKATPPPPRVTYCNEAELLCALERVKKDNEYIGALEQIVLWFNRGECNKNNYIHFYNMIQVASGNVKRLQKEKEDDQASLKKVKLESKKKLQKVSYEMKKIERFYEAASQQKVWDYFTKAQRKNIDSWKTELELLDTKSGSDNDMDISDDEPTAKKIKLDTELKETNEKLRLEIEAYKNEIAVLKSVQKTDLEESNRRMGILTNSLKTAKDELMQAKIQQSNAETKINELDKFKRLVEQNGSFLETSSNKRRGRQILALKSELAEERENKNNEIEELKKVNTELQNTIVRNDRIKVEEHSKLYDMWKESREKLTRYEKESYETKEHLKNLQSTYDREVKEHALAQQKITYFVNRLKDLQSRYDDAVNQLKWELAENNKQTVDNAENSISNQDARIIGLISTFLLPYCMGARLGDVFSYVQRFVKCITEPELEFLMNQCYTVFRKNAEGNWILNVYNVTENAGPSIQQQVSANDSLASLSRITMAIPSQSTNNSTQGVLEKNKNVTSKTTSGTSKNVYTSKRSASSSVSFRQELDDFIRLLREPPSGGTLYTYKVNENEKGTDSNSVVVTLTEPLTINVEDDNEQSHNSTATEENYLHQNTYQNEKDRDLSISVSNEQDPMQCSENIQNADNVDEPSTSNGISRKRKSPNELENFDAVKSKKCSKHSGDIDGTDKDTFQELVVLYERVRQLGELSSLNLVGSNVDAQSLYSNLKNIFTNLALLEPMLKMCNDDIQLKPCFSAFSEDYYFILVKILNLINFQCHHVEQPGYPQTRNTRRKMQLKLVKELWEDALAFLHLLQIEIDKLVKLINRQKMSESNVKLFSNVQEYLQQLSYSIRRILNYIERRLTRNSNLEQGKYTGSLSELREMYELFFKKHENISKSALSVNSINGMKYISKRLEYLHARTVLVRDKIDKVKPRLKSYRRDVDEHFANFSDEYFIILKNFTKQFLELDDHVEAVIHQPIYFQKHIKRIDAEVYNINRKLNLFAVATDQIIIDSSDFFYSTRAYFSKLKYSVHVLWFYTEVISDDQFFYVTNPLSAKPIDQNTKNDPPTNSNTKNGPPTNSNTKNDPSTTSNTKNDPPTNTNTQNDPPTNSNSKNDPSRNSNTKNDPPTNTNTKNDLPTNTNTKNDPPTHSNTKNDPPTTSNTKNDPPTNTNTQNDPPTNSNSKNDPSRNSNTKNDPPTNTNTKNDLPTNTNTKNDPSTHSNTKNDPPTNTNTQNDPPTNCNTTNDPPTNSNTTNDPPTNTNTQNDPPTNSNSKNDPSRYSNTKNDPPTNANTKNDLPTNTNTKNDPPTHSNTKNDPPTNTNTQNNPPTNCNTTNDPPTNSNTTNDPPTNTTTKNDPLTNYNTTNDPPTNTNTQNDPPTNSNTRQKRRRRRIRNKKTESPSVTIDNAVAFAGTLNELCTMEKIFSNKYESGSALPTSFVTGMRNINFDIRRLHYRMATIKHKLSEFTIISREVVDCQELLNDSDEYYAVLKNFIQKFIVELVSDDPPVIHYGDPLLRNLEIAAKVVNTIKTKLDSVQAVGGLLFDYSKNFFGSMMTHFNNLLGALFPLVKAIDFFPSVISQANIESKSDDKVSEVERTFPASLSELSKMKLLVEKYDENYKLPAIISKAIKRISDKMQKLHYRVAAIKIQIAKVKTFSDDVLVSCDHLYYFDEYFAIVKNWFEKLVEQGNDDALPSSFLDIPLRRNVIAAQRYVKTINQKLLSFELMEGPFAKDYKNVFASMSKYLCNLINSLVVNRVCLPDDDNSEIEVTDDTDSDTSNQQISENIPNIQKLPEDDSINLCTESNGEVSETEVNDATVTEQVSENTTKRTFTGSLSELREMDELLSRISEATFLRISSETKNLHSRIAAIGIQITKLKTEVKALSGNVDSCDYINCSDEYFAILKSCIKKLFVENSSDDICPSSYLDIPIRVNIDTATLLVQTMKKTLRQAENIKISDAIDVTNFFSSIKKYLSNLVDSLCVTVNNKISPSDKGVSETQDTDILTNEDTDIYKNNQQISEFMESTNRDVSESEDNEEVSTNEPNAQDQSNSDVQVVDNLTVLRDQYRAFQKNKPIAEIKLSNSTVENIKKFDVAVKYLRSGITSLRLALTKLKAASGTPPSNVVDFDKHFSNLSDEYFEIMINFTEDISKEKANSNTKSTVCDSRYLVKIDKLVKYSIKSMSSALADIYNILQETDLEKENVFVWITNLFDSIKDYISNLIVSVKAFNAIWKHISTDISESEGHTVAENQIQSDESWNLDSENDQAPSNSTIHSEYFTGSLKELREMYEAFSEQRENISKILSRKKMLNSLTDTEDQTNYNDQNKSSPNTYEKENCGEEDTYHENNPDDDRTANLPDETDTTKIDITAGTNVQNPSKNPHYGHENLRLIATEYRILVTSGKWVELPLIVRNALTGHQLNCMGRTERLINELHVYVILMRNKVGNVNKSPEQIQVLITLSEHYFNVFYKFLDILPIQLVSDIDRNHKHAKRKCMHELGFGVLLERINGRLPKLKVKFEQLKNMTVRGQKIFPDFEVLFNNVFQFIYNLYHSVSRIKEIQDCRDDSSQRSQQSVSESTDGNTESAVAKQITDLELENTSDQNDEDITEKATERVEIVNNSESQELCNDIQNSQDEFVFKKPQAPVSKRQVNKNTVTVETADVSDAMEIDDTSTVENGNEFKEFSNSDIPTIKYGSLSIPMSPRSNTIGEYAKNTQDLCNELQELFGDESLAFSSSLSKHIGADEI